MEAGGCPRPCLAPLQDGAPLGLPGTGWLPGGGCRLCSEGCGDWLPSRLARELVLSGISGMQLVFWGLGVLWFTSLRLATPLPAARLDRQLLPPSEALLPLHTHTHVRPPQTAGSPPLPRLQVFSVQNSGQLPSVALKFPKIKIINWFDIRKTEVEAQARAARSRAGSAPPAPVHALPTHTPTSATLSLERRTPCHMHVSLAMQACTLIRHAALPFALSPWTAVWLRPDAVQGNTVDWTVTGNLTVRNAFLRYLDQGGTYWRWLPYFQQTQRGKVCADYRGAAAGR